jgi:preprotein translocase subunit Sec61beta
VERVLAVVAIAAAVMVERPGANKAVMAAIGSPGDEAGDIRERSRALWSIALGDADGLSPGQRALGRLLLPDQLAIAFRGVLSFWTAGEIRDEDLQPQSVMAAATALLGFVDQRGRERLIALLRSTAAAGTA